MDGMGERGPKPGTVSRNKISQRWTPKLAYAVGLLASDGCLTPVGHHINLTSKDREQIENFRRCLEVVSKIGRKSRGGGKRKIYFCVQFKNVLFYNFLESVGLTPRKSKTIGRLQIPEVYFFDFLRGVYDGDGCSYSYWDRRWLSSFMFYTSFASASTKFLKWLEQEIYKHTGERGRINKLGKERSMYQLRYAKKGSLVVLRSMYHTFDVVCLSRKRLKIEKFLATVGERLS